MDAASAAEIWNKENLLKMEIESNFNLNGILVFLHETKKISWKWRLKAVLSWFNRLLINRWNKENLLKMEIERRRLSSTYHPGHLPETKKISWKWRLKAIYSLSAASQYSLRNKENLLKMEIERRRQPIRVLVIRAKQRKSPENGDWKNPFLNPFCLLPEIWNKENLLKMEIESYMNFYLILISSSNETKKISWKWRLKAFIHC